MDTIHIILIVIGVVAILFFSVCYICFRMAFYSTKKGRMKKDDDLPPGSVYEQFKEQIYAWRKDLKNYNHEEIKIKSFDGLTLCGRYYEFCKGAPIEIMFHGYRGYAERDLSGGINRCIQIKKNVLIVDHRAHGDSDGRVITFGIKERYDVKSWADYAYNRFGKDIKLYITGISMGASSVLMASSLVLPETVVGVIADCGFTSGKDIIKSVIKSMGLPPSICYPFVKLGGLIYGRFNIDQTTCLKEIAKTKIPVMLVHGDKDELVPCKMSVQNQKACKSHCKLEIIEGAGHGTALLVNPDKYKKALKEFDKYCK